MINSINALIDSNVVKSGLYGIHLSTCDNSKITNNNISHTTTGSGIYIASTDGVLIFNNLIYNTHTGISTSSGRDILISENTVLVSAVMNG